MKEEMNILGIKRPEEQEMSMQDVEPIPLGKEPEDIKEKQLMAPVVARIHQQLSEAEQSRLEQENQWIRNINAYRGKDDSQRGENGDKGTFRESEVNKPYVRTTTVKTRAAYSQIMEALMQNSRFPLMMEATPISEGAPDLATNDPNAGQKDSQEDFGIGFEGDGRSLEPGATLDNLSWKEDSPIYESLNEGKAMDPKYAQISPSGRAAEQMTRIIHDQLEESNAHMELRKTVFEACLLGTGIMKGVFTEEKTIHKWTDGVYSPEKRRFPKIQSISTWDLYIDPNAYVFDDAEWVIERHRMTSKQLRDLKQRAFFRKETIDRTIASGPNYTDKHFELTVREDQSIHNNGRLWEVLEYWGYMSVEEAMNVGLEVGDLELGDQVQVNMWICGTEILRVMVNPFLPQRLPYFLVPYEVDPYSVYGTGVPETMQDSQKMMNGFARLAVDNLALAGNLVFDVDESVLVPGQDMEIYPGKIFRRQGGQTGTSINGIKFPSTANENMQMFREFRQMADESTGIPSVSHGQTGVTGVGRTSSGLSMILENASLNIKTVIRNIDEGVLQPMGKMLFYWNQQFNADQVPNGDYDVIATGIRSYTKQEIKVQRLQTLLGLVQNPALAPMIKLPYIVRELVKGMDLNPDEVINDMEEAKLYAEIIGLAGGMQGGPQSPDTGPIQGQAQPGSPSFTGNTEGAGNMEGVNSAETPVITE
jgi:hypothetical protein